MAEDEMYEVETEQVPDDLRITDEEIEQEIDAVRTARLARQQGHES